MSNNYYADQSDAITAAQELRALRSEALEKTFEVDEYDYMPWIEQWNFKEMLEDLEKIGARFARQYADGNDANLISGTMAYIEQSQERLQEADEREARALANGIQIGLARRFEHQPNPELCAELAVGCPQGLSEADKAKQAEIRRLAAIRREMMK